MFRHFSKIYLVLTAALLLSGLFSLPAAAVTDVPNVKHYEEVVEGENAEEAHAEEAGADGHEAHGEDHSSGGLPQLDATTWAAQGFWLIIIFVIMYVFFSKAALPNISNTIENRKNHIDSDLETAEKLTAEADAVHDAYQENLTRAQEEAAKAIQDVENSMKVKSTKAFDDFRKRSEQEIQAAEERIVASKEAAMNEMNEIAAQAASQAVEKIIGQSPDVNQVKSVVENLNGMTKAKAA